VTRETLMARWTEMGDKVVRLAAEFPDDRYEFRPAPEARSFAEQLRHVAFWNGYVGDSLRGATPDGDANELPRDRYATKGAIVPALEASFGEVARAIADAPADAAPTVVPYLEHNGEHYGQLVVYYRLNGLVPPASR
jgi:hypothetical protein